MFSVFFPLVYMLSFSREGWMLTKVSVAYQNCLVCGEDHVYLQLLISCGYNLFHEPSFRFYKQDVHVHVRTVNQSCLVPNLAGPVL